MDIRTTDPEQNSMASNPSCMNCEAPSGGDVPGPAIVVLGAGVVGLTAGLLLEKAGSGITRAAKHMPGDYDMEYTSPRAFT